MLYLPYDAKMAVSRGLRAFFILVALLVPGAGCLGDDAPAPVPGTNGPTARPVVIALIDSGINPYHEAFRAAQGRGAEAYAAAFGAETVGLSTMEDYGASVERDAEVWSRLETDKLYAFAGTRLLAISVGRSPGDPAVLDLEGHGTATASLAAREDPDALLVMIQFDFILCDFDKPRCSVRSDTARAMEWAADQDWIDVISVSVATMGNPPEPGAVNPDAEHFLAASRLAHDRGKVVVNAAGNYVAPPFLSHHGGPPWTIAVGGAQAAQRGEAPDSAKSVDLVANYTEWIATGDSTAGWRWGIGTSYGTPVVAGTLSRALTIIRQRDGPEHVPPGALRDALNATAVQFSAQDYRPTEPPAPGDPLRSVGSQSLPILVSPVQMGWGYVDGSLADEIARRVLEEDLRPPPAKAMTAQYQAQWQGTREAYWNR